MFVKTIGIQLKRSYEHLLNFSDLVVLMSALNNIRQAQHQTSRQMCSLRISNPDSLSTL